MMLALNYNVLPHVLKPLKGIKLYLGTSHNILCGLRFTSINIFDEINLGKSERKRIFSVSGRDLTLVRVWCALLQSVLQGQGRLY